MYNLYINREPYLHLTYTTLYLHASHVTFTTVSIKVGMTQPEKVLRNARLVTIMYTYQLTNSYNWCNSAQTEFEEKHQKILFLKMPHWSPDYRMQLGQHKHRCMNTKRRSFWGASMHIMSQYAWVHMC